jgi:hypothetical protein
MKKHLANRQSLSIEFILAVYLWILMLGLFLQGSGSLALRLSPDLEANTPPLLAGILIAHIPHALLHIFWGAAGIVVLATLRSSRARIMLGLVFGTFYTLLAIVGTMDNHIFNLHLAPSENGFHWIVGPLTLGLSLLTWYAQSHASRIPKELSSSDSRAL